MIITKDKEVVDAMSQHNTKVRTDLVIQVTVGDLSDLGKKHYEFQCQTSGPRFNIKMSSYQYRKFHCGDKTVVRSSYLHNGISYAGKMSSLY